MARIDVRLARYAELVGQGQTSREAALAAGYSPTTVRSGLARIEERARDAGLLVSPDAIRSAVEELEAALPEIARELVAIGLGRSPKTRDQLAAIREVWDRARGKPKQAVEAAGAGMAVIPTVFRVSWPGEDGGG